MRKGFTLVELLAVIVVLAIISLIATPALTKVVSNAKKSASLESARGYIDSINTQIISNDLDMEDSIIKDGTYSVDELNVEAKGQKPSNAIIKIEKNQVKEARLCVGKYSIDYDGKNYTDSSNDYCGNTKVTLVSNGKEITNTSKGGNSYTVDLKGITNINCNNGAIPEVSGNTLTVKNTIGNTTCELSSSLKDTFSHLNKSDNNVVMVSDDNETSNLLVPENKKMHLDLNGKTISSTQTTISNKGILIIDSKEDNGTIKTTGNSTQALYSLGKKSVLTVNNGHIIGTNNCSDWNCNAIRVHDGSNLIINSKEVEFDNAGNYKNGVYVEAYNGIGVWIVNDANAHINGGFYNVNKLGENTPFQALVCSKCNLLEINNANTNTSGGSIRLQTSGNITINGGYYVSDERSAVIVDANTSGSVKITAGTYISKKAQALISVTTSADNVKLDIISNNKPIYMSTLSKVWTIGVHTNKGTILNIKGPHANKCTSNSSDTKRGICFYSEGDGTGKTSTNGCAAFGGGGIINIDGGTFYGGWTGILSGTATLNIKNAEVAGGRHAVAVSNGVENVNINICSSKLNSEVFDMANSGAGKDAIINYDSKTIFTDGTNTPKIWNPNSIINANYMGTCTE